MHAVHAAQELYRNALLNSRSRREIDWARCARQDVLCCSEGTLVGAWGVRENLESTYRIHSLAEVDVPLVVAVPGGVVGKLNDCRGLKGWSQDPFCKQLRQGGEEEGRGDGQLEGWMGGTCARQRSKVPRLHTCLDPWAHRGCICRNICRSARATIGETTPCFSQDLGASCSHAEKKVGEPWAKVGGCCPSTKR